MLRTAASCSRARALEHTRLVPTFDQFSDRFWEIEWPTRGPATDSDVAHAEELLGVKLPDAYIELLHRQNGGIPRDDFMIFPAPADFPWDDDYIEVGHLAAAAPYRSELTLLDNADLLAEWEMPQGLVLLEGDGHCWIALDYRTSGPTGAPTVVFYDNEREGEGLLAETFVAFLEGLRPETSDAPTMDVDVHAPEPVTAEQTGPMSSRMHALEVNVSYLLRGERSLEHCKQWADWHVAQVYQRLDASRLTEVSHARRQLAEAPDPAEFVAASARTIQAIEPLVAEWLGFQGPGWGIDAFYLRQQRG
jgi:hypothetical protein